MDFVCKIKSHGALPLPGHFNRKVFRKPQKVSRFAVSLSLHLSLALTLPFWARVEHFSILGKPKSNFNFNLKFVALSFVVCCSDCCFICRLPFENPEKQKWKLCWQQQQEKYNNNNTLCHFHANCPLTVTSGPLLVAHCGCCSCCCPCCCCCCFACS